MKKRFFAKETYNFRSLLIAATHKACLSLFCVSLASLLFLFSNVFLVFVSSLSSFLSLFHFLSLLFFLESFFCLVSFLSLYGVSIESIFFFESLLFLESISFLVLFLFLESFLCFSWVCFLSCVFKFLESFLCISWVFVSVYDSIYGSEYRKLLMWE